MGDWIAVKLTQVVLSLSFVLCSTPCFGQWDGREEIVKQVEKMFGDPPGMTRLDPVARVWADPKAGRVVVDGYIALRAGQLEMFACPVGTKEHESVVAVFSKAKVIHVGLLAVGANVGSPVKWDPKYEPPTGSEVRVVVLWKDPSGKKQVTDARQWIHELGTEVGTLDTNFVFAGSSFWKDPDTGKEHYQAESGDLICVSNFTTAMLDVPIESSKANSGLLFATFTDRIPERETPVRLVLQVVSKAQADPNEEQKKAKTPLDEIRRPAVSTSESRPQVATSSEAGQISDRAGQLDKAFAEELEKLIRD